MLNANLQTQSARMCLEAPLLSRMLLVIFVCSLAVTTAQDADFQCDILSGTTQGIMKTPVDTTTTPPLFGQEQSVTGVVGKVKAVEVDVLHGRIYWIDEDTATLNRANMNGSDQMTIANECDSFGIAVHPEVELVYFTTYEKKTVEVVNADGSGRTKLYEDTYHLTGLAVDTRRSLAFFVSGGACKIHKMNLDGSGREVIVSGGIGWPHCMALDRKDNRICWSDTPHRNIECADYNGEGRSVLIRTPTPVFAILIEDDFLYWTAKEQPMMYSAHRDGGEIRKAEVTFGYFTALVRCKCPLLGRYELEPPVKKEMSIRLNDANNGTCLMLADTPLYRFEATGQRWLPHPRDKCWMSGLVIKRCVPDAIKTSFTVTITGHHLTCSTSHFRVGVRKTKWSGCELAGKFNICKWGEAVRSGELTTCVAACRCDGDDCKHVIVHFPTLYEEWKICEINLK